MTRATQLENGLRITFEALAKYHRLRHVDTRVKWSWKSHWTCLRSICFYFHLCSFHISKGFQPNIPWMWWSRMECTHITKTDQILAGTVAVAVTGMYTRYKDISRVQFSHIFSPILCIWLTNLQGREKDLLRRKAQRYCWRRLLRYIFQGFMQGRYLAVGSRWLCVENDDMRLHAGGKLLS